MTDMNETNLSHALPGQERYVAPLEETPLKDVDSVDESAPASSLWADAWRTLRKNPMFIISAVLIVFIIFVALFPGVMTKQNPNYCTLENSLEPASKGHPFGFDLQGCDVYSRVVHGTRTSLSVGVFATVLVVLLGTLIGALSGFFGGWVDTILSRLTDIFLALPKNLEFNTASTALGSTPWRNLFRHILPNSLAPIIVVGTTSLATYIVLEATLSFLGVGLPTTTVSWGGDISNAQSILRTDPMVLFYPSAALAITVLAFIMMGDAVKDALDPKSRT